MHDIFNLHDFQATQYASATAMLAAALDLQGGEAVQWQLLSRSDLRLLRLAASPAKPNRKK